MLSSRGDRHLFSVLAFVHRTKTVSLNVEASRLYIKCKTDTGVDDFVLRKIIAETQESIESFNEIWGRPKTR